MLLQMVSPPGLKELPHSGVIQFIPTVPDADELAVNAPYYIPFYVPPERKVRTPAHTKRLGVVC